MAITSARSSLLALALALIPAPVWAAGQLMLESTPQGASVMVNGQRIGETPLLYEGLGAGTHTVTLMRPGYLPQSFRVTIEHDLTTRHRLVLTPERRAASGELVVSSMPSGAEVYLNGRLIGRTPLQASVPVGSHRVVLRQKGYEPIARTVRIVADLTTTQRLSLEAIAPAPPPPLAVRPEPTPEPTPRPQPTPSPTPAPTLAPSPAAPLVVPNDPTPSPVLSPVPASPAHRLPRVRQAERPLVHPPSAPEKSSKRDANRSASPKPTPQPPTPVPAGVTPRNAAPAWRLPEWRMPDVALPSMTWPHVAVPDWPRPAWPAVDWETQKERLQHAAFSLVMLGFVATLGHAIWRQRPRPLDWQPDIPSSGFQPLSPSTDERASLAARTTELAIRRADLGDVEQALSDLREAFRLSATPETAYNLALGWERVGMPDWAEVAYHTALQLDPAHVDAGLNLANLFVAHGRPLEALRVYRELAEHCPDNGAIAYNRGNLLASLQQLDRAVAELKRAQRLLPGEPAPRANLAIARRRKRAAFWKRALPRGPRAR